MAADGRMERIDDPFDGASQLLRRAEALGSDMSMDEFVRDVEREDPRLHDADRGRRNSARHRAMSSSNRACGQRRR
jgi:hypothetical protein